MLELENSYTSIIDSASLSEDYISLSNNIILFNILAILMDVFNDFAIRYIFWWFLGLSALIFHKDAFTK